MALWDEPHAWLRAAGRSHGAMLLQLEQIGVCALAVGDRLERLARIDVAFPALLRMQAEQCDGVLVRMPVRTRVQLSSTGDFAMTSGGLLLLAQPSSAQTTPT